jgi:Flp pilus assembly protein TadG
MNRPTPTRRHALALKSQRGAAVIEFALILPLLLIVLVGTMDASLALYDKAVITNASREGARAGIVARNPPLTDAQIQQIVQNYLQGALVSLGSTSALPAVQIQKGIWNGDPTLQVTVRYTFQGLGLGLGSLMASFGKPWDLQSSTVMVYE